MVGYFFDSYAVIELLKGNPSYTRYSQEPFILSLFNLVEVYWNALHELGEQEADALFERLRDCVVELSDDVLKEAIRFRKKNKKRDLSYADCIGYCYALQHSLLFLTGDKEFEGLLHVEFVK